MPPTMLIDLLQGLRRKVRFLSIAFGLGVVAAAAVGALLGTVLLDYLLNLAALPRLVLALAAVAGLVYGLFRFVLHPALAHLSLSDIAGHLEQTFPQFDDRLRSTVDFVGGNVPGSTMMQERVVTEATQLARSLDLNRALALRPVGYSLLGGAGAVLLLSLVTLLTGPQYCQIALARLVSPFGGAAWPKSVQIQLVGDVPQRVPVGHRVDLRMRLARGDRASRRAIVYYQSDGGPVQQEYMARGEDGVYAASLDARADAAQGTGQLRVWIRAGDDQTVLPPITVVPRLAISRVEAAIMPPAYAQLPPISMDLSAAPGVVAAGADVLLRITFNKPLDRGRPVEILPVSAEMKTPSPAWDRSDGAMVRARWTAEQSLRFHIRAADTDGFQNVGMEEYELIVRPDQNPTVQIENPRRNEERTPAAVVPLQAVAEDDYGLKSAKLVVSRLGPASAPAATGPGAAPGSNHWEIDLVRDGVPISPAVWSKLDGVAERQRFRINYAWELSALANAGLKSGDVLEFFVQVEDNFELNGRTHPPVASGRLRVSIISQEELNARLADELRGVAYQVNDIRKTQNRLKGETSDLAADTEKKPALDAADRAAADRLANQQSTAASQTRQVAGKLEEMLRRMAENRASNEELKSIAADVRTQLNQASENPMKEAGRQIGQAGQPRQPAEDRNAALKGAVANQQQASDQLQQALDRMGNIGSLQQTIDTITGLLEAQRRISKDTADVGKANLGRKPEQMSAEDREKLDKAAQAQETLGGRTEKVLADVQKLAEQLAKRDPSAADAMRQAAQTGQQQQVSPNQFKAAQQARQNQQSGAQAAQRAAELGLEMVLSDLRNAERRKLEELARQLEQAQQLIANLIRRQAGHNLDNLTLQGPDALRKLEATQLDELKAKAERASAAAGGNAPPAPLPQLSLSQEQTERNTRDIAKTLEAMANGAEPAAHLTKAAGRMERAIVMLRESRLPDAYEPPQVQALAALEQAKRLIDEQKAKADQKREQQQKEAIRQVYVRIRQAQEKLNKDSARIDSSPRLDDGSFKREDAIRLGQLPGEQGKLAEQTQKVEDDLSALGSLVYTWANRDIVSSMNAVKDDLGRSATGAATQAEQARILAQLDAMIASLAIKPPEQKFEQRAGGGDGPGGGGAPKLPPEVELRLLKELQIAINRSTKAVDAQPQKDKPKLLALGGRQGELRGLLGELLAKASGGRVRLGPEPDSKDQLPEEAKLEQVEGQELLQDLLKQEPTKQNIEKDANLIGDRMGRSRQRLALNQDPGKTTQMIQDRIIQNLDDLIQMARNQESQSSQQPMAGPAQLKPAPKPGQGPKPADTQANAAPKPGASPAGRSVLRPGADPRADLSQDIRETMREWGGLSERQRQAVIEGADESVVGKYRKLVDDYYRSLAKQGVERQ